MRILMLTSPDPSERRARAFIRTNHHSPAALFGKDVSSKTCSAEEGWMVDEPSSRLKAMFESGNESGNESDNESDNESGAELGNELDSGLTEDGLAAVHSK